MVEDLRKDVRRTVDLKWVVHSDESMTYSKSVDFSHGGVFITTLEPLKVGTEVDLSFPVLNSDEGEHIDVKGIVRWVKEGNDLSKSGMGIEFLSLSEADLERVKVSI